MILDILLSVFKFCQAIYIFKYKPCWSNFINKTQNSSNILLFGFDISLVLCLKERTPDMEDRPL